MRYLVGFTLVLALGVMPLVGCSEAPECQSDKDCDDQNECTEDMFDSVRGSCVYTPYDDIPCDNLTGVCIDGICQGNPCDDGNECTDGQYNYGDGSCSYIPLTGRPCDWNAVAGVCIDGMCGEDPCEELVCDDDDPCTDDRCGYDVDGARCLFTPRCRDQTCLVGWCDPADGSCVYTTAPDGATCGDCNQRVCRDGVCVCEGFCTCIQ